MQPSNNSAGTFGSSLSLLNFNANPAALNSTVKPTDQLMPNNLYHNSFSNLRSSSANALSLANHSSPFHMPAAQGQSTGLDSIGLLTNDSSHHKSSSKEKKSKDKDRSEKHHKKHKSKDKHHKKHKEKSKEKDRSSKHHSGSDDKVAPSPIKLIIKKGGNEEKSEGLKIVIPKPQVYTAGGSDRKRRQSSSREREHKMVKLER